MSFEPGSIGRCERLAASVRRVNTAPADSADRMARVGHQESTVLVRGTRIHVLSAGSGPALLYLHGGGDLGTWMPVLSELAQRYTVYRPDHPGFNESDDRPDIESIHDLAFFYLDLLDALEVERVIVVGSSLGGWLAADLATIEPARLSGLILVNAAGVRADVPTPDMFTLSAVELADLVFHNPELRSAEVADAEAIEEDPPRLERYLRNRISTAHLGWNPYLHDHKLPGRLHRIDAPTLILWGGEDRLFPVGYARRWAELLPHAELSILANAGHLPLVEQPAAALDAIWTFLDGSADS
jgi:pimeloyl-ACP methyl ester carboxylesterase